ncbi:MAG: biopolymer transporter ExbD [Oligoflexia bacterium]|nr:biopolymer transporter ExbD [Oligoflexia bacterium]
MMVSGEGGKSNSQDFELNLASIIDCLTVLITFVLASASFLSIGLLDAGIAAAGAAPATDAAPPSVNVTVELGKDQAMIVKLGGKATSTTAIPAKAGAWDHEALVQNLSALKQKWPDLNAAVLTAGDAVEYRDVVKTMETMRKAVPAVLLGGF